jgi:hypothetical protein
MPRAARHHLSLAIIIVIAAAAAIQLAAFWPGVMVWDAIRQYGQALSGRYDDWHPPAMNWLWRQLGAVATGPAPMLVVQAALYWSGFALLAAAALRDRRRWPAAAIIACALLPVPFLLIGTVLKDSLMAGALLTAAGLIAVRRRGDVPLGVAAAAMLVAAATLRFNAVPACLPLAAMLAPPAWRRTPWRLAAVLVVATGLLAAALPVANRLLHADRSGVELSLVIYDLGGITRFSGSDAFPPVGVADPVAVNARCYTPVSWDSYAWWGPAPCAIGFANVRDAFAARWQSPTSWWLRQIAMDPVAYARHRLAHADRNLRWWVRDADLPTLSLETDPNPWGFRVAASPLRAAIDRVAVASLATPLGWPICWLALAAACLVVRPRGGGLAAALAWSALLYALSYVPLSVASEVRYHLWTMTAAALATVLTLADLPAVPRWRWGAAALLVGGTVAVAVAARLTLS